MSHQINTYDWCVINKVVKGKQFTIIRKVDDLKMLHVDFKIVSSVLSGVDPDYGNISKMIITWGKIHNQLKMTIDQSYMVVKVKLSMVDYIVNITDSTPEDMKR